MTYQELFIDNKDVLIIHKSLASILGDLNEAVVLNQLNYWIERYKETNHNFKDGKHWVYNSYKQWAVDNFPFWSETTVKRTFTRLENKGIVVSANYNQMSIDKTKWYSIDYKKLQEYIDKHTTDQNEETSDHKDQSTGQNDFSSGHNEKAIPENTTDITNRDYNTDTTDIYAFSDKSSKVDIYASVSGKQEAEQKLTKKSRYIPKDYTDEQLREHIEPVIDNYIDQNCDKPNKDELKNNLLEIISEFHREYEKKFGEKHRILADVSYENIAERYLKPPNIMNDNYDTDAYSAMIEQYFIVEFNKRKKYNKPIEISLSHFMSDEIRGHLYWQTCV